MDASHSTNILQSVFGIFGRTLGKGDPMVRTSTARIIGRRAWAAYLLALGRLSLLPRALAAVTATMCVAVLGGLVGFATNARGDVITFVSDTSWTVLDASAVPLGSAQFVCLSAGVPASCPPGATLYGDLGSGWSADLSGIPGAAWIWAPGITGTTPSASFAQFSFFQQFDLHGLPISGTISVAVDDFAEVLVNGTSIGTTGSVADISLASQAQSALKTFDLAPFLVPDLNTI